MYTNTIRRSFFLKEKKKKGKEKKKREGNSFKCMCIMQKINEGWRGIPDVGNVSDWVLHRQRKGAN